MPANADELPGRVVDRRALLRVHFVLLTLGAVGDHHLPAIGERARRGVSPEQGALDRARIEVVGVVGLERVFGAVLLEGGDECPALSVVIHVDGGDELALDGDLTPDRRRRRIHWAGVEELPAVVVDHRDLLTGRQSRGVGGCGGEQ